MKEFTILYRRGNGKPYTLETFKTIQDAQNKVYQSTQLEAERNRPFYVDNDYFENIYNIGYNVFYMCILEREVTTWKKLSLKQNNKNNISFLL